jgi:hypothetical protein
MKEAQIISLTLVGAIVLSFLLSIAAIALATGLPLHLIILGLLFGAL